MTHVWPSYEDARYIAVCGRSTIMRTLDVSQYANARHIAMHIAMHIAWEAARV